MPSNQEQSKGSISQQQQGQTPVYIPLGTIEEKHLSADLLQRLVPTGAIIEVAGNVVPPGFHLCDGASYSRTTYAKLFAAIGTRWGTASGTHFNVPDLRGYFTRGQNAASGRDPDAGSRVALLAGGITGDNVGSYQDDATGRPRTNHFYVTAVGDHVHYYVYNAGNQGSEGGGGAISADEPEYGANTGGGGAHDHYVPVRSTPGYGGDSETRPKNAYVLKCIKY